MRIFFYFFSPFFISILFFSCDTASELSKEFSCEVIKIDSDLETVNDFYENFSIKIPTHWNTKLYYDETQSEIFSADTLKDLSESYIIDFALVNSELDISKDLSKKIHQKGTNNDMKTLKESFHKFKNKNAYAHLGVGRSKGMALYIFQYYIKVNDEKYMMVKTEFYGENDFEPRFCEALSIINQIKFN